MINNGRFQVFFRRRQNQANYPTPDDPLINVIVVGEPGTGEAKYLPGNVDNVSTYKNIVPVDGWYDFSNYIEDTEGSTFTWDKINQGDSKNSETSKDGSNYDKGISANLFLFDKAFQFVYDWLVLFDYQIINCVEVRIVDLIARAKNPDPAGNYRIFEIKNDNLDYAPVDENCQFHVKLREQDLTWHCIHKTIIHDDWQKWFNEDGTSTKAHPTFLTCIEGRPRLVQSARMALSMFFHGVETGIFPIALVIDWITEAPTPREDARRIMNANRFIEAPFIHTLIENVALKCGMTTDTIFDTGREWEKLCLFFPRSGEMHESESDDIVSPAQTFHWGNRWDIAVPDLLDKLKIPFAAEWYVTPQNKIVFAYIKDLLKVDPIYDFTAVGAVKVYHLRYSFNGDKKPAYGEYRYQIDPVDEASQEVNPLYSDTIGFDQANNPMLEGEIQKNFDFAPTGFVRDGRAKDYMKLLIKDGEFGALILVAIIAIIAGAVVLSSISIVTIPLVAAILAMLFATATAIAAQANKFQKDFVENDTYTGAVRLTAEQTTVPRLLLWDGVQTDRAKVVRRTGLPVIYPYYNRLNIPYNVRNIIDKDNPSALVFNYPLYFDGFYYDNMFTRYHDVIDNPLKSRQSHQTAKFELELCEDMQNLFGMFQNQYAQIGKIVKLETRDNYDVFVRITNILEDYNGAGKIEITGQVIKRPTSGASNPDQNDPGNLPVPIPDDGGDPTPPPIGKTCFRWQNNGTEPCLVTYTDCEGTLIAGATIEPGHHFCAWDISLVSPNTIVASSRCDDPLPSDNACYNFINFANVCAEDVSYVDCDNVVVTGATVCFLQTICAKEILSPGTPCSNLVNTGPCDPCAEPCCTPVIESVTTSDCIPVDVIEFSLPVANLGVPYEFRISLNPVDATGPFVVTPTDIPSWMTITIDEDTNELVFSGTPDATTDLSNVFFNYSNCGGDGFQDVGTFIQVIDTESLIYWLQESAITGSEAVRQINVLSLDGSDQDGYVDWGDGIIESFTLTSFGSRTFFHAYADANTAYTSTVYFVNNAHLLGYNDIIVGETYHRVLAFTVSPSFTNASGALQLVGVDDVAFVIPSHGSFGSISFMEFSGHPDSTMTTLGLSSLLSNVDLFLLHDFPLLASITNFPSTINSMISINANPNLTSIAGSFGACQNIAIYDNGNGLTLPTINYSTCNQFRVNQDFSVSQVNAFLVGLDGNGLTGGNAKVDQTPDAPPSGAGATAVVSLGGKGWTTITD